MGTQQQRADWWPDSSGAEAQQTEQLGHGGRGPAEVRLDGETVWLHSESGAARRQRRSSKPWWQRWGISLLALGVLTGCGGLVEDEVVQEPSAAPSAAPVEDADPEPETEPEPDPKPEPEAGPELEPEPEPAPEAAQVADTWTVTNVVDGDTIDVRQGSATERVRVIGIDTPERGECGFGPASSALSSMVLGEEVTLTAGSRDDRDRYGRIVRYVDIGDVDAGLSLIEQGFAVARYDSRDGYGKHPRQDAYIAADDAAEHVCGVISPAAGGASVSAAPSSAGSSGSESGLSSSGPGSSRGVQPAQAPAPSDQGGIVKRSDSGICHAPGTTYYDQTRNFTPYDSTDACLAAGGRLPKR